jgi:type IV secretion system protein VirB10
MNRRPLGIVFGVFVLVMGVVYYTILERTDANEVQRKDAAKKVDAATAAGVFDGAPSAGLIAAKDPIELPPGASTSTPVPATPASGYQPPAQPPGDANAYAQEWQQYRQQQGQLRQAQVQAAMSALSASPAISEFGQRKGSEAGQGSMGMAGAPGMPGEKGVLDRLAALAQQQGAAASAAADTNNAKGKAGWLATEPNPANYLEGGRKPPVSPYEIKTGTVIPGVMIGGVNSDLPGQIIAQVRENVWDTATGRHLLIPQGARLVGTYDNAITRGQTRVLVAWTRIIYPDGSSVDLGSMPGADQAGYAGFKDKVNNHYVRVFGDAMLLSLFSAGIQLSQPRSNNNQGGYDSQQIIAGALGQQLGQAGMQMVQQNLAIQPTLEIRPGYRFNIMVTKDMILSPWREGSAG